VTVMARGTLEAHAYFDHCFTAVEGEPTDDHLARSADALLALARVPPSASVLDFGCGAGFLSIEVARRGYRVVGADRSEVLVRTARRLAQRSDIDLTFVVGTAQPLGSAAQPLGSQPFSRWGPAVGVRSCLTTSRHSPRG